MTDELFRYNSQSGGSELVVSNGLVLATLYVGDFLYDHNGKEAIRRAKQIQDHAGLQNLKQAAQKAAQALKLDTQGGQV